MRTPTLQVRTRESPTTVIGGIIAVACIIQVVFQGLTMRNTGLIADAAERLEEMAETPSTPFEDPLDERRCTFTPPFENWTERVRSFNSSLLTIHVDTLNSGRFYLEVGLPQVAQGVQFGITAVRNGGWNSHFQLTEGLEGDGFVWMMKMAKDNTGVEFFQSDLKTRVAGEDSDYHKIWEDSRLPGLRLKMRVAAVRFSDMCSVTHFILDAATLVRNGFYAVTVPPGASAAVQLSDIKAFGHNIALTANFNAWNAEDSIRFCIYDLPQDMMLGRRADSRAGYFVQEFRLLGDFSGEEWPGVGTNGLFSPTVRLINRMRLPSRCSAELGRDETKLHFYVDPTVPRAFWEATRAGIELWEPALAAVGSGIKAWTMDDPEWPTNYDFADICFNTVSWATGNLGMTFAIGQSVQDPRSGETLKANIIFTLGWLRNWMGRRIMYGAMSASAQLSKDLRFLSEASHVSWKELGVDDGPDFLGNETVPPEWMDSGPQLWSALANPSDSEALSFLEKGLRDVTAHEVGHTLGLRHNFRASTWLSFEDAQRTSVVSEQGLGASIMDYNAFNILSEETRTALKDKYPGDIPDAQDAPVFSPAIGAYDKWVIEYGYSVTEEESAGCPRGWCVGRDLEPILAKFEEQGLEFSTDETLASFDPYTASRDLGSNPIDQYEEMFKVAKEGYANMFQRNMDDYQAWTELYHAFKQYRTLLHNSAYFLCRFIGGVRALRKNGRSYNCTDSGAGCDKQSNTPVSEVDQDRALTLVLDSIVNTEYEPPEWYQKEAVKEIDWLSPTPVYYTVLPVQVNDEINTMKKSTLGQLLGTTRLKLVRLSEQLLEKEHGSMILNLFRTCSNRLLGMDLSDADMRELLQTSTHLHDVRAEYVRLMNYYGDDQIVKAAVMSEQTTMRSKVESVLQLVQADSSTSARLEEFFLISLRR